MALPVQAGEGTIKAMGVVRYMRMTGDLRGVVLILTLAAACQGSATSEVKPGDKDKPGQCIGTDAYFRDYSWPEVFSTCVECHKAGGQADGTRFILKPDSIPNFLSLNMAVVTDVMAIEQDGKPLLVLKATNAVPHGGKKQLSPGSKELEILEETIARLKMPVVCSNDVPPPRDLAEGVKLLDAYGTLRKATWQLVGRPPTQAEVAAVDASGLAALDTILGAQMQEPAFHERVREIFSDVFLTDGFRANNTSGNSGNIINNDYYPNNAVSYWGGQDWDWRSWPNGEGIRLVEALAREPVEMVVRAVKKDLPMSEILTGKFRLLNAYSARFFKVPYKGAPVTDFSMPNPQEYVEVTSVPGINESAGQGEYAGILTTTAFLNRYPSSPTNFNRKRARFTYKYFLDFDIMKTSPRIDASAVNLDDHPTRRNDQCTGCHAQLDPLAGAFMNQDECGYEFAVFYQPPGASTKAAVCNNNGWVIEEHMFAPGVGAGAANQLSVADRPKALEKLAAHIVAQQGFADAIVSHVYVGLMGRTLLVAPADPMMPGYAALDAAYNAEKATLVALNKVFKDGGLRLKPLILALVKSSAFRAADADDAKRLELLALGGGALTSPEILNRKIIATIGYGWRTHLYGNVRNTGHQALGSHDGSGEARLILREQLKTLYGGIDGSFDGVKARQRLPSTLTAAIVEHMALEMSCVSTTRDFDKASADRLLFPKVEKTLVVSGDATGADQAPIIANLRHLHERFFGERLEANDPEILASYELLKGARDDAQATGKTNLSRPCRNDQDLGTGVAVSGGTTNDPTYMVRAWQAVIAYMLMDYRFVFEL